MSDPFVKSVIKRMLRDSVSSIGGKQTNHNSYVRRPALMRIDIPQSVPAIGDKELSMISGSQPEFITRHIEEKYLPFAKKGYFRMGTLADYQASETDLEGRLGDHQESRQLEVFRSRQGYLKTLAISHGRARILVEDTQLPMGMDSVVIETFVNDFCSCSSIGKFELARAITIRDREIDKDKMPGAYVTYHLESLKAALMECFQESDNYNSLRLLGREIEYGAKDRHWDVEKEFGANYDSDSIAIWLGTVFIKSPVYTHEDEFRLLLLDLDKPGSLRRESKPIEIKESRGIAAAIHECGIF